MLLRIRSDDEDAHSYQIVLTPHSIEENSRDTCLCPLTYITTSVVLQATVYYLAMDELSKCLCMNLLSVYVFKMVYSYMYLLTITF